VYPDAACRDHDPELFFAERGRGYASAAYRHQYAAAQEICFGCPIRARCLEENLDIPDGVWGGLDRTDRGRLLMGMGRVSGKGRPEFRNMSPIPNDNQVHAQRARRDAEMAGDDKRLRDLRSAERRRALARSA
jgi:hypothetical protein